jgi:hypothetical protein
VQGKARHDQRAQDHDEERKPATEGVCPVCGTKMFKIGG